MAIVRSPASLTNLGGVTRRTSEPQGGAPGRILSFGCASGILVLILCTSYAGPALALGGPDLPEQESFEPVTTSDMVNLFTGDFVYNIPLLDVDGYPLNIAYHAANRMDAEASMVGFGWNINPGDVGRVVRGLPDDFNGDPVTKLRNARTNWTLGFDVGGTL